MDNEITVPGKYIWLTEKNRVLFAAYVLKLKNLTIRLKIFKNLRIFLSTLLIKFYKEKEKKFSYVRRKKKSENMSNI